eukprot:TCONS_00035498-protein
MRLKSRLDFYNHCILLVIYTIFSNCNCRLIYLKISPLFFLLQMATNNDRKLWEERAQKLKRKRMGQDTVKGDKAGAVGSHILAEREMTVQRLSSVATGKAMKFNKMGPQEFVAYPFDELTIENLIQACSAHFRDELLDNQRCDILQSQDGPSCSKLSHIKSYKVIYVRLITNVNQASISIRKYFDKMKMPPRSPLSSINVLNSFAVST